LACASQGKSVVALSKEDILDDLGEVASSSMGDHGDSQMDVEDIHKVATASYDGHAVVGIVLVHVVCAVRELARAPCRDVEAVGSAS